MALTDRGLGLHYTKLSLVDYVCMYVSFLREQLNPSPMMNGSLHVHVKSALSSPSLVQSALGSHGSDRQGSGTVVNNIIMIIT